MSEPFLSEIRVMSFGFPPTGWALCDGQLLPINQNQALFSLLGTTYGGDGRVNFALPDLQARAPMHMGNGHILGERGGEQSHTLSISELPTHAHVAYAQPSASTSTLVGAGNVFGAANIWAAPNDLTSVNPGTVMNTGSSQPHLNMQPFLTLTFCIALQGIFPSQN